MEPYCPLEIKLCSTKNVTTQCNIEEKIEEKKLRYDVTFSCFYLPYLGVIISDNLVSLIYISNVVSIMYHHTTHQ